MMNRADKVWMVWGVLWLTGAGTVWGGDPGLSDPAKRPSPPVKAMGYPSRDVHLDALPGFVTPPSGYGEVPFWWWTGDKLNADRMIGQIKALHAKGISGVQVNYSHFDTPGWMTDQDEPRLFTEAWWDVYSQISEACAELNMGIGLSTYTIDWPRGAKNLFYDLFYRKPELNAIELKVGQKFRVQGGDTKTITCEIDQCVVWAYPIVNGKIQRGGVDLAPWKRAGKIAWTASAGDWEILTFRAVRKPGSLNPLMPGSGDTVIRDFFQQFQDRNPGQTSQGLNYFFNDELHIGVDKFAWNEDFLTEFQRRKGYQLLEVLPAMWVDIGDITPKVRMDYADVRMSLMEERYFKPIYDWHASRGMIYACDSGGRGRNPHEFGDYFRATRWYSAPGHDTPGGRADLIKGKVSSSIANLYQQPRVWLEGYHSLGWGAAPELLMFATRENYLYGCTLLNLHGFYYTTYGSHWEWAPPCYHFRMPYWAHMDVFLGYFDRLSYLMSQGHMVCDVAVVYPVAPFEAEMNGNQARDTAFDLGSRLMAAGINFEFIDNDSLARAEVRDGRLVVEAAQASYQALVFPDMSAVRWESMSKAAAFAQGGGHVYAVGAMPSASDRMGRNDPELKAMTDRAFKPEHRLAQTRQAVEAIGKAFVQDVAGVGHTVRALHRRAGPRDVYLVMDAAPHSVVEFRTKGAAELWDPWTGKVSPLRQVKETSTGTQVELPLESYEAQIVVFTPGKPQVNPPSPDTRPLLGKTLTHEWTVAFVPTMDNTYGDFRMPVTLDNKTIGVEARRFAWAIETKTLAKTAMLPETSDQGWDKKLHGYGTKFYVLGPVPKDVDLTLLDARLASLRTVDSAEPVKIAGRTLTWTPYDFSWRYGKEGNLGHQGYHGLKRTVTDDFICLGKTQGALNETRYVDETEGVGSVYYLWTSATTSEAVSASILASQTAPNDKSHTSPAITPAAVYINGARIQDLGQAVPLRAGANPMLVRYNHAGRGHFVLRRHDMPEAKKRTRLAMRWHNDPGVIPFDVYAGDQPPEWFRFLSAPGTQAIRIQAHGTIKAWIDGKPMKPDGNGRFAAASLATHTPVVALRVKPDTGHSGGAAIPEPIQIETSAQGILPLGDWSAMGILNNYSGGVRYSTTFALVQDQTQGQVEIDLGRVAATAEVHINGKKVGVRVAPPWRLDVTGFLKPGQNTLEVLVYNTLSNHYQTIPSRYRGKPVSGLMGPVRLLSHDWITGEPTEAPTTSKERADTHVMAMASLEGIQVTAKDNALKAFDQRIQAKHNLLRQRGFLKSTSGTRAHEGGGHNFSALFNGTAGNGRGGEDTVNDGKTFVGMANGNTLDLVFNLEKLPAGVPVYAICTYAGHHDERASQTYSVYAAKAAAPNEFVKIADVDHDSPEGINEVQITAANSKPLMQGVSHLRFVFKDCAQGFSVYREIAVLGKQADER